MSVKARGSDAVPPIFENSFEKRQSPERRWIWVALAGLSVAAVFVVISMTGGRNEVERAPIPDWIPAGKSSIAAANRLLAAVNGGEQAVILETLGEQIYNFQLPTTAHVVNISTTEKVRPYVRWHHALNATIEAGECWIDPALSFRFPGRGEIVCDYTYTDDVTRKVLGEVPLAGFGVVAFDDLGRINNLEMLPTSEGVFRSELQAAIEWGQQNRPTVVNRAFNVPIVDSGFSSTPVYTLDGAVAYEELVAEWFAAER